MISIVAVAYVPKYPVLTIVPALLAQTDLDWEAVLIHDGPGGEIWESWKSFYDDPRIRWRESRERGNLFGHDLREMVLENEPLNGHYLHLTNSDNYVVPQFVSCLNQQTADVVAWPVIHNYLGQQILFPRLEMGQIDLCSIAVRCDLAMEIGFPWREHASDWLWVQEIQKRTADWKFLSNCITVHN